MKTLTLAALLVLSSAGCASGRLEKETGGPQILQSRASPATIEVNRYFQPTDKHQILAEVKDAQSEVTDVRLRFVDVPVEVPMEKVGATTWRGALSSDQIKRLAVSGRKMGYEARVVAKNDLGKTSESEDTIEIQVRAPEFSDDSG